VEENDNARQTGYPSVDKPRLKYYQEQNVNIPRPECKYVEYIWQRNRERLDSDAFDYLGKRITYRQLFDNVRKTACGLRRLGIKSGDIVTVFSINTPETLYCDEELVKKGSV
jgi:long-chain acyl-CoA synthetase